MRQGAALTLMSWISRSTGAKFADFSMGMSFPQEHAGSASASRAPASGRRLLRRATLASSREEATSQRSGRWFVTTSALLAMVVNHHHHHHFFALMYLTKILPIAKNNSQRRMNPGQRPISGPFYGKSRFLT